MVAPTPDRSGSVPVGPDLPYVGEELALGPADVGHLDNRALIVSGVQVGEAALLAADGAFLRALVAEGNGLVVQNLIVRCPVGDVLRALAAGIETLLVDRRRVVT